MGTGVEICVQAGESQLRTGAGDEPRLEIRLIGELEVRRGEEILPLPRSKKCRALIAYLAAQSRPQRRERLCEIFWEVPDDPKGALRWSLSKIRRVLGDALVADRETVSLAAEAVSVDAAELISNVPDAASISDLERLASRCGQDFAGGLDLPRCPDFQTWLAALREDVRQAQLKVLTELVRRLRDEPHRALPLARTRVERDPLDEQARADLVAILIAAGRGEEAERQREIAVAVLKDAGVPVPAALSRPAQAATPAPAPKSSFQRVQFCTTPDGTRIACSVVGSGPPLVKTANWLSHLEYEWESPLLRPWLTELSRSNRLIRYDERGNGLSDRRPAELSLGAFVQDLETVTDSTAEGPFDLIGISQGCAVAIAFAVKHPARVRKLILFGGFAMGWNLTESDGLKAQWEAMITLTGAGWGTDNPAFRQMFTSLFVPRATPEQAGWFNELQRVSASAEEGQRLQRAIGDLDVRNVLDRVRAPTIIFHSRNDALVPCGNARYLASRIPNAELVGLESENHLLLEDEPAWQVFVERLREFLTR